MLAYMVTLLLSAMSYLSFSVTRTSLIKQWLKQTIFLVAGIFADIFLRIGGQNLLYCSKNFNPVHYL